jgi:hypothetical protein
VAASIANFRTHVACVTATIPEFLVIGTRTGKRQPISALMAAPSRYPMEA